MRDLRKNMLASSIKKVNKEKRRLIVNTIKKETIEIVVSEVAISEKFGLLFLQLEMEG